MALVEVGEQARARRLPADERTGERARRRTVETDEVGEPREVRGVGGRDRSGRYVEVPADHRGYVADRDTFVGDRVQHRPGGRLREGEAEEVCGIEPVHGGPTVRAVAEVAGD